VSLLIHYSEIAIKGNNREFFEKILENNIKSGLGDKIKSAKRMRGIIICDLANDSPELLKEAKEKISLLPGVATFSFVSRVPLEMGAIREKALALMAERDTDAYTTFKVNTRRSNKQFPLDSHAVDCDLGDAISTKLGKVVKVRSPEVTLGVEIGAKEAFLSCDKFKGVGGLPVGCSGKLVSLLSGGIDSPVSSFMMMKRGAKVILVHALNRTLSEHATKAKLDLIAARLSFIQGKTILYMVPFHELQQQIISAVPAKLRMISYRRFMMRIAHEVALSEGAKGVITGDSLGQVASQTLENLQCVHAVARLPVYSPLIGMNKEETVDLARKIGTYEASSMPSSDCCSFMIDIHPETKANLEELEGYESVLEVEKLVQDAVSRAEKFVFSARGKTDETARSKEIVE